MFGKIVKNLTYVSIARILAFVISFGINIIFVRYLGSSKLGIYITVITFVAFFGTLMDMGFPTLLLRSGGENKSTLASKFTETIILKIIFSAVAFVLMYVIMGLLDFSTEMREFTMIAFLTAMFASFSITARRFFYIYEDLSKEAIFVIITPIIHTCLILILVQLKSTLFWFFIVFMIESTLMMVVVLFVVFKKYNLKLNFNTTPKDWVFFLWQALPFAAIGILGKLHRKIDIIMLSKLRNDTEVGLYGVAYKFVDVTLFLPAILSSVLLPVFSGYYAQGRENEFREIANKMINLCITLVLPVVVLLVFFSPNLIPFLYGKEFVPSSAFLSILSFAFICMFPNAVMGTILYAIKKQNITLYNTLACFAFNAILNSLLIPRCGAYGSAITAVLTQILLFTLNFSFLSKELYMIPYISLFKIPLISAFSMSIFIFFTRGYVWLSIPGAIFLYFGLSFLLGNLKVRDIRKFLRLFS